MPRLAHPPPVRLSAEGSLVGTSLINFFLEMRYRPTPPVAAPKTVSAALEAYVATTIDGKDCPNRPSSPIHAASSRSSRWTPPSLPAPRCASHTWSANGSASRTSAASLPAALRHRAHRRDPLAAAPLYEGEMLDNCLQGSRSSQAKYLSRARNRSSFWSSPSSQGQRHGEHVPHRGVAPRPASMRSDRRRGRARARCPRPRRGTGWTYGATRGRRPVDVGLLQLNARLFNEVLGMHVLTRDTYSSAAFACRI